MKKVCLNKKTGDTIVNPMKQQFIKGIISKLKTMSGSYLEVGIYKGGSAKLIADSRLDNEPIYLFDTFEGIPYQNDYDNRHIIGDFADVNYDEILTLFKFYENVSVHKGIFPEETHDVVMNEKFKFVHIDVDVYQSYIECLEFLYPRMVDGGYMVFDDYNEPSCEGATKACDEFFKDKPEEIQKNNMSYYIKKI